MIRLLFLLMVIVLAGCGSSDTVTSSTGSAVVITEPAYVTALRPRIEQVRQQLQVPGLFVSVRTPAGDWNEGFGGLTAQDHWRIGSVTKTFTATVVLQLVGEGKLRLEDPIAAHFEGVPNGANITIQQLLDMRSGLYNYTESPTFLAQSGANPQRVWRPEELLTLAFANPPLFTPGAKYTYCNTNYIILGLLIEKLTGQKLETALQDRIFIPLQMAQSTFPPLASNAIAEPHAQGFQFQGTPPTLVDVTNNNPSIAWAAGAIISTPADMAVYLRALVDGGLLPPALQRRRLTEFPSMVGPGVLYGLGLGQIDTSYLGHNGEIPGFNTFALRSPERGIDIIVWANVDVSADGKSPAGAVTNLIVREIDRVSAGDAILGLPRSFGFFGI